MKAAEQWVEALNAQEGADVNPCNITPSEVRAIQADALRHAAEIAKEHHAFDTRRKLLITADKLERTNMLTPEQREEME